MAMQTVMVGLLVGMPSLVTGGLVRGPMKDPANVRINVPTPDASGDEPPRVRFNKA